MKAWTYVLLITMCATLAFSQATTTPNIGLNKPAHGDPNWDVPMNQNSDILDSIFGSTTSVPGIRFAARTFANLDTEANGKLVYCSDCQLTTPCASGGTGAVASGVNGVWACSVGTSAIIPPGITYATTSLTWSQSPTSPSSLTGGTQATVTLSPCPVGVDTVTGLYQVLVSGGGNAEAVTVTGGTCTGGSGTVVFTPFYSYGSGYAIGSASSGIQETINQACGTSSTSIYNSQCNVTIPANGPYLGSGGLWSLNNYTVYGTIFWHASQSVLNGYGVSLNCVGRGPCLQIGDRSDANHHNSNVIQGLTFRSPTAFFPSNNALYSAYYGINVTNTAVTSGVATITTDAPHNFRPGDLVVIQFTDDSHYWGDAIVTDCGSGGSAAACTTSSTTFRYAHPGADIESWAGPGVVALAYTAILDNANGTHLNDIVYDKGGDAGQFNNFFDFWDDENATIDHFNNSAISLNDHENWVGAFVFAGGAANSPAGSGHQLAPVITIKNSNMTANYSLCVTDYASNGLYMEDTVCQASSLWQVKSSNETGNYQGAIINNVYSESGVGANPAGTPYRTPFHGLGVAGLIAGVTTSAGRFNISGNGSMEGAFPTGGSGSTPYTYYIVANDTTNGTQTSPMQILNWLSTGSDSPVVKWPRVANGSDAITYDVIRMTTPVGIGGVYPWRGGCGGGSGGTCGYVAQAISQATACAGTLICSFTDTISTATSAHSGTATNFPAEGTWAGPINFWPGAIVTVNTPIGTDQEQYPVVGVGMGASPIQIAKLCGVIGSSTGGVASAGGFTAGCSSGSRATNSVTNQTAMLLDDGGDNSFVYSQSKGLLNFSQSQYYPFIAKHHMITIIDSQPGLTRATSQFRPPASDNDTYIGTDAPTATALAAGQLAFGAPVAISNYIANRGDNTNFLERLTASAKTFTVPVTAPNVNIGSGGGVTIPSCTGKYVKADGGGCGDPSGTGLTGISSGGGLTLSGQNVGMITSCSATQVLAWSGSAWGCTDNGSAVGGNAAVATLAGFFPTRPSGMNVVSAATGTAVPVASANQVFVYQFTLPYTITVNKIVVNVPGSTSTDLWGFGIYSSDGNTKLIDTGAWNAPASSGYVSLTLGTPVQLLPGVYYFAQTSNGTTATTLYDENVIIKGFGNANRQRTGLAANASSSGVLPSALGAISTGTQRGVALVWFEN